VDKFSIKIEEKQKSIANCIAVLLYRQYLEKVLPILLAILQIKSIGNTLAIL